MPSAAFVEFESNRLGEVKALALLDPSRTKGADADVQRVNAVNRGSAVLLAAHLQGFLEDLVVEAIDWLNRSDLVKSEVPPKLMAAHVERHLGEVVSRTELVDRLSRVERLFDSHELYWTDCGVAPDKLDAEAVTRHIGNPWPKVIKWAVVLLGGDDPFDDPALNDPKELQRRLGELVGKRNDIAHGSGAPPLTSTQIDQFMTAAKDIARAVDDQIGDLVQSVCRMKTRPWP